jgi:hypothetical protein
LLAQALRVEAKFKMTVFFQFETDFVESLRCIPMAVRYHLDTCGIKLKLHQWNNLDLAARSQLVEVNIDSLEAIEQYRNLLIDLIQQSSGEVATFLPIAIQPPWLNDQDIPIELLTKAHIAGCDLKLFQWQQLSSLQRFALIKLSKSSHEQNNFLPALREFKLI